MGERNHSKHLFYIFVAIAVVTASQRAISSGQSGALVRLQATTPGLSQTGHLHVSGTVLGGFIGGDGSALINLNATNLAAGTVNDARIPNNIVRTGQAQTITGNKTFSGSNSFTNATVPFSVTSNSLVANLNADLLDGMTSAAFALASHSHDGADIASGMVPDARLNSNIVRTGSNQTISGNKTFSGLTSFTNGSLPFSVTSNSVVANLNADLLDGLSATNFVNTQGSSTITGNTTVNPILSLINNGAGRGLDISSGGIGTYIYSPGAEAFVAVSAADGFAAEIAQWNTGANGNGLRVTGGPNGGIGMSVTGRDFGIEASGSTAILATGSDFGLKAFSSTNASSALYAEASGAGSYGVQGRGETGVVGVGTLFGIKSFSSANNSTAMLVSASGSSSFGIRSTTNDPASTAILATAGNSNSIGISTNALYTGGIGIRSTASTGLAGQFVATSGNAIEAFSNSGLALAAQSVTNDGITAISSAANKSAVYAYNDSTAGATAFGVYASSRPGTYGGYFIGNVHVVGTLSKAGGAFMIDHPQNPEGAFLTHSFVESPDMKNIYDGTVVTDDKGYATVMLPDYFDSLNESFRYQLTVLDSGTDSSEWVMARVARKIENNQFVIRTSAPKTEVSWMVTGIRKDKWAQANRIVPERLKGEDEHGFYLNPEAFNQPEDRRLYGRNWIRLQDAKKIKK